MSPRRTLRWSLTVLLVSVLATTLAMWPRDDLPREPDAVIVLGGSPVERVDLAIQLQRHHGGELVLPPSAVEYAHHLGIGCGREAICIEPRPDSTAGEARHVAELASERGWTHITLATTRFHTTRARVLFRQCLEKDVTVVGAPRAGGARIGPVKHLREVAATVASLTFRRPC
jgi:uncharacterized SAM-binding protein YcdF (DUF218 family)